MLRSPGGSIEPGWREDGLSATITIPARKEPVSKTCTILILKDVSQIRFAAQ